MMSVCALWTSATSLLKMIDQEFYSKKNSYCLLSRDFLVFDPWKDAEHFKKEVSSSQGCVACSIIGRRHLKGRT